MSESFRVCELCGKKRGTLEARFQQYAPPFFACNKCHREFLYLIHELEWREWEKERTHAPVNPEDVQAWLNQKKAEAQLTRVAES